MVKEIIRTDLSEHPAVEAWRELRPGCVAPVELQVLKRKPGVYRLIGAGPEGSAVIAKRSLQAMARIERTVYEQVLPRVPLSAPRYYGFVQDQDPQSCWIFLEDSGDERYSPRVAEHRVLATRWMAVMHTAAAEAARAARLPDRGPGHYLEHLRSARSSIRPHLSNSALCGAHLSVLWAVVSQCDALEAQWGWIEQCCKELPLTLVHGDFTPRNVHVRSGRDGLVVVPFDWETAGLGVPAADLAECPDIETYWSIVRDEWRGLDIDVVYRLVNVGTIFRSVAGIYWATVWLDPRWLERPIRDMELYLERMARCRVPTFTPDGNLRWLSRGLQP